MKKGKLSALIAVILVGILVLGTTGCQVKYTQEELDLEIETAKTNAINVEQEKAASDLSTAINKVKAEKDSNIAELEKDITGLKTETSALITEKNTLAVEKAALEEKLTIVTEEKAVEDETNKGYLIDGLQLGATDVSEVISDRDIETLFDGEIEFDGEDFDAEEKFSLTNLIIAINKEYFNGKAYLEIPAESVEYTFLIANDLNTSLIEEDETLKFNFLGEEVEVSEWGDDEITFSKGTKKALTVGESYTDEVEGKTVLLRSVGDGAVSVKVSDAEGSESRIIKEGDTEEVYGLEIKVNRVLNSDEGNSEAELEFGEEVSFQIKDGKEYAKDSIWDYKVRPNSLSLVINEEFLGRDADDDYIALAPGEKLSLPNDYKTIEFNGVSEEDVEDYDFDLGTGSKSGYVKAKGNFLKGIEDYSKIYINMTTGEIYDSNLDPINTVSIDLGDTGLELVGNSTHLTINDIVIANNLTQIIVAGDDISNEDDDYLNTFGILIKNPEDSVEDAKVDISIPEEALEASITVY